MDKKVFTWDLDIYDSFTQEITGQVVIIALGLAVVFAVVNIGWNYLTSGFKKFIGEDDAPFPNYLEIARIFTIMIVLTVYLPIAGAITGVMEAINFATAPQISWSDFAKNTDATSSEPVTIKDGSLTIGDDGTVEFIPYESIDANGDIIDISDQQSETESSRENKSGLSKIISDLGEIASFLNPINLITAGIHAAVYLIVSLIRWIIYGVIVVLTKILIIVGPFAFAFSIIPCFEKQIEQWFATVVTTGLTLTTLNLLTAIMDFSSTKIFQARTTQEVLVQNGDLLAIDIIMIILYCSCFWITSKYVGKGDAGRVVSKLVATGTAIAALAMSGGASGGATNIGSATNVGKSALEAEE